MGRKLKVLDQIYDFIDYKDTIIKHGRVLYKASCKSCGVDRGYKRPNKFNKICVQCQCVVMRKGCTSLSRLKQSIKMKGRAPVNKRRLPEHVKLRHCISSLVYSRLKKRSATKGKSFFKSIGYSFEQLTTHLESKFQPGMSWDNYGKWHVDHIIPDSWFKYKNMDDGDFKKSWSLENLQPLWAIDNFKKSDKVI